MWNNLHATLHNASALVGDAVGELGTRLDGALQAMDEDIRLAVEGEEEEERDKALFYRDQLLEFQMEQIKLTREYQALLLEKENEIGKLRAAAGDAAVAAAQPATPGSSEAMQLELEVLKTTAQTWEKKLRHVLAERNEAAARAARAEHRVLELSEKAKALQEQVALSAEVMESLASAKVSNEDERDVDAKTIDGLVDDYSRLAAEAQEKEESFAAKVASLQNQNEELKLKNRVLENNLQHLMNADDQEGGEAPGENGHELSPGDAKRQVLTLQMELYEKERELTALRADAAAAEERGLLGGDRGDDAGEGRAELEEAAQRLAEAESAGEAMGKRLAEMQRRVEQAEREREEAEALRVAAEALRDDAVTQRDAAAAAPAEPAEPLEDLRPALAELEAQVQAREAELATAQQAAQEVEAAAAERLAALETVAATAGQNATAAVQGRDAATEKLRALEAEAADKDQQLAAARADAARQLEALGSDQASALETAKAEVMRQVEDARAAAHAEAAAAAATAAAAAASELATAKAASEAALMGLEAKLREEQTALEAKLAADQTEAVGQAEAETRQVCEEQAMAVLREAEESFAAEKEDLRTKHEAAATEHAAAREALEAKHEAECTELSVKAADEKRRIEEASAEEKAAALAAQAAGFDEEKAKLAADADARVGEAEAARDQAVSDLEHVEVRWRKLQADALTAQKAELDAAHLAALQRVEADRAEWEELYKKESQRRKLIHNKLMELQGNIRVLCRARPILPVEMEAGADADVTSFPSPEDILITRDDTTRSRFEFDRTFAPGSTQLEVFDAVQPLVVSLLDGYNVCIFAYGQTGSGKTHTMEGPTEDPGVNLRALQELFALRQAREADVHYRFRISMLEIYNEQVRDLLETAEDRERPNEPRRLDIRQTAKGNVVPGLTAVEVEDVGSIQELMSRGAQNRSVGGHNMNERSSRSHSIVRVMVLGRNVHTGEETRSKLHLIDLAGSERISKTDATGDRLKEAQNINRSLSALGDVIAALASRNKGGHVPFRNSKLTFLLQDSLGGNSKVLMFVNISPAVYNVSETLCSLNFAARCRAVELGGASRNVDAGGSGAAQDKGVPKRGAAAGAARQRKR